MGRPLRGATKGAKGETDWLWKLGNQEGIEQEDAEGTEEKV